MFFNNERRKQQQQKKRGILVGSFVFNLICMHATLNLLFQPHKLQLNDIFNDDAMYSLYWHVKVN